jgi:hypothetical protein
MEEGGQSRYFWNYSCLGDRDDDDDDDDDDVVVDDDDMRPSSMNHRAR